MSQKTTNGRRKFLKTVGAAGVTLPLAGCLGGGDGGGDGGDGGGGTVTDTGAMELQEVSLTAGANPWILVEGNYIIDEGILAEKFESLGYTPSMEFTYGGPSLFASGQTDIAGIGPTEANIMAANREFEVVIPGKTFKAASVMTVRPGSPFDPEEVGGREQAIQNLAEEGVFGIGGWEGNDVKMFSALFPKAYGLEFKQEGGDFTVNSTGDYAALPQLVVDGDLDLADAVMTLNSYPHYLADPPRLTNFAFLPDLMNDHGYTADAFAGIVTRKEFADENPDLLAAYVDAWQEGADWFFSDPIAATERYLDSFGDVPDEDAEFIGSFGAGETEFGNQGVFYENVAIEDEWLDRHLSFMEAAEEAGTVPSGWADWAEYRQV